MYFDYLAAGSCHCLCMKVSVANLDPEVRSSGTIACGVMYTFVMPKLRIRIRHLKVVSIYLITKLQTKSLENALQAYFVSYLHELWEQNLLFEVPKLCLCLVLIQ